MLHLPAVGKAGRIEDDQVKPIPRLHSFPHIAPRIFRNARIRFADEPVGLQVILAPQRICRGHVHGHYFLRTPASGIYGKPTGIREEIQDGKPRTEIPHHRPGPCMIQEQARIDAPGQVDGKRQAVLVDDDHQGLVALYFVLFSSLTLLPLVKNHVIRLDVQHSCGDIATRIPYRFVQAFLAIIGNPRIRTIEIDGDRKPF